MILIYVIAIVVAAAAALYFAWRSREFLKFLAGAFFVSTGVQVYLYLARVPVPLLGTDFIQTPELSALRSIPNFLFFLLALYFGFLRKPKA